MHGLSLHLGAPLILLSKYNRQVLEGGRDRERLLPDGLAADRRLVLLPFELARTVFLADERPRWDPLEEEQGGVFLRSLPPPSDFFFHLLYTA